MPQPVKRKDMKGRSGPKIVLERPRLAALIGAIASEWGAIDDDLGEIFDVLTTGTPTPQPRHSGSEVAAIVFSKFISLSAKLDVIRSVVGLRLTARNVGEFEELSRRMRKCAIERNKVIHARWMISDEFRDDLLTESAGHWLRYTEKYLEEVLDRTVALKGSVRDFLMLSHRREKKPL